MGLVRRLEKNIVKLEKRIEKEQMKIENLRNAPMLCIGWDSRF